MVKWEKREKENSIDNLILPCRICGNYPELKSSICFQEIIMASYIWYECKCGNRASGEYSVGSKDELKKLFALKNWNEENRKEE